MKHKVIILALLLISSTLTSVFLFVIGVKAIEVSDRIVTASSMTIYVPDNYTTIQAAINAANPGDTIFVSSGTYPENLVVNKSLTLIGENKSTTIIDGDASINVIRVSEDNINIGRFTIQSTGTIFDWGISIEQAKHVTLHDNIITAGWGIEITGVNNTICSNNVSPIIWVTISGSRNIIHNNTIHGQIGISGSENTVAQNMINGIECGIGIESGIENIMSNNTIFECSDEGIYVYSDNNMVSNNSIMNNGRDGIFLYGRNNTVLGNSVSNNYRGIEIDWQSGYNNVSNNVISNNTEEGILSNSDYGNIIFGNNISYNGEGIYVFTSLASYTGHNVLRANQMIGNNYGLEIYEGHHQGLYPYNNIDTSNTVDGKPVYYLVNQSNIVIDPFTFPEIGYLGIAYSKNVTVRDVSISKSGQGIFFCDTTNITVQNVTLTNNKIGIDLRGCWSLYYGDYRSITDSKIMNNEIGVRLKCTDRTVIRNNMILNNSIYGFYFPPGCGGGHIIEYNMISGGEYGLYDEFIGGLRIARGNIVSNNTYGIYLEMSGVKVYHNNFINNTNQMVNTTLQYCSDWQHEGIGNYWSDYNGTDLNGDGIGDTNLPWQKVDNYPLMNPWRSLCQLSHPKTISIFQVHLEVDTYFSSGYYLRVEFYSYDGLYQGNITVRNGTTPSYVDLSINVSHPLDNPLDWNERVPVEKATLVLTDENGTIISSITTFVMTRRHLFERLPGLDWLWMIKPPLRPEIFKEIIDIDGQWPYAPP